MITFILAIVCYFMITFIVAKLFWVYGRDRELNDKTDAVMLGLIWPLSVLCFIATHSLKGIGNVFNAITSFMEKKL